jgi:hypothetical protein
MNLKLAARSIDRRHFHRCQCSDGSSDCSSGCHSSATGGRGTAAIVIANAGRTLIVGVSLGICWHH